MFNIFSKKTPVALSVTPYLRFVSVGKEVKIIIDSGEEDLNQRVAQFRLDEKQSASINRLFITGFDTIYHRLEKPVVVEAGKVVTPADISISAKTSDVMDITAKINNSVQSLDKLDSKTADNVGVKTGDKVLDTNAAELTAATADEDTDHFIEMPLPYELLSEHVTNAEYMTSKTELNNRVISSIEDAFEHDEGIILGQVWLELSNGELLVIAAPIYTVVPDLTDGGVSFVSVPLAQDYIEEEWRSEFTDALLSMDAEAPAAAAMPNRRSSARSNTNSGFASNNAIRASIAAAIVGVLLLAYAFAGVPSFLKADSSKPGASAGSLYGASLPIAQANASSDYDPYAPSTTGMPSAEQYAQMQTAATKDVLRQMNVDLDATADLGCLSN